MIFPQIIISVNMAYGIRQYATRWATFQVDIVFFDEIHYGFLLETSISMTNSTSVVKRLKYGGVVVENLIPKARGQHENNCQGGQKKIYRFFCVFVGLVHVHHPVFWNEHCGVCRLVPQTKKLRDA